MALCLIATGWHLHRLDPLSGEGAVLQRSRWGLPQSWWGLPQFQRKLPQFQKRLSFPACYHRLLLSFIVHKQKWMWAVIKLFTCAVFYGVARNNTVDRYDLAFVFVFFNFGILANGVLLHRVREFEETRLFWYTGLPVRLWRRWLGYAGFCFVLLLPEMVTAYLLTPVRLHYGDAFDMICSSHSLLLLIYGMLVLRKFSRAAFLRLILFAGAIQYLFVAMGDLTWLYLLFYSLSFIFFYTGYYRYEIVVEN